MCVRTFQVLHYHLEDGGGQGDEHRTTGGRYTRRGSTDPACTLHLTSWKAEVELLSYCKMMRPAEVLKGAAGG